MGASDRKPRSRPRQAKIVRSSNEESDKNFRSPAALKIPGSLRSPVFGRWLQGVVCYKRLTNAFRGSVFQTFAVCWQLSRVWRLHMTSR